jgi:hypothetical protein
MPQGNIEILVNGQARRLPPPAARADFLWVQFIETFESLFLGTDYSIFQATSRQQIQ